MKEYRLFFGFKRDLALLLLILAGILIFSCYPVQAFSWSRMVISWEDVKDVDTFYLDFTVERDSGGVDTFTAKVVDDTKFAFDAGYDRTYYIVLRAGLPGGTLGPAMLDIKLRAGPSKPKQTITFLD